MNDLRRSLWVSRALCFVLVMIPALISLRTPWGVVAVLMALLVEFNAIARLGPYLSAVLHGEEGELMFANGHRVPLKVVAHHQRSEKLELATGLLVGLVGLWASIRQPAFLALVAGCLTMLLLIGATRWALWRQHTAYLALMDRQPARALRLIAPLRDRGGPLGVALTHTRAAALSQSGQPDAARRELEALWSGAFDATAALLATTRLRSGDTELARSWLAADHPSDRYHRYLTALVRGHLALVDGTPGTAITAAESMRTDVPPFQQRELTLILAAAHQQRGDTPSARTTLDALEAIDDEGWRAQAQPLLWHLIEDARAGRASPATVPSAMARAPAPPPEPAGDAFAAPASDQAPRVHVSSWRGVGAVPCEQIVLGRRSLRHPWVLRGLVALLAVLVALLILLTVPMMVLGGLDPQLQTLIGAVLVLSLVVGAIHAFREAVAWRMARPSQGVRLSDGRVLPEDERWLAWWWVSSPLLVLVGLALIPVGELAVIGSAYSGMVLVPLSVLSFIGVGQRARALRACLAAHHAAPGQAVATIGPRRGGLAAPWTFLAFLVDGRPDHAQAFLEEHAAIVPMLLELGLWLRASRGDVDLDRLLAQEPQGLGEQHRLAVAQRLAALYGGRCDRLAQQIDEATLIAEQLPNRFGGLLHRLNHRVLAELDPERAAAYAADHASQIEAGAWADRCWPDLLTSPTTSQNL